ncbi:MAG: hypothetical protein EB119_09430 [Synechococcaceae bacterium WBB_34_004]|nr:hypothetical protein [Synechococcaceae bacterium WBB_34_004]
MVMGRAAILLLALVIILQVVVAVVLLIVRLPQVLAVQVVAVPVGKTMLPEQRGQQIQAVVAVEPEGEALLT